MLQKLRDRLRRRPAEVTPENRLKISYVPRPDGDADPGEVVWTWVPYEDDPRQGKDRPVLVIGTLGKQLAVLPLTSKDRTDHTDCIELGSGAWDGHGRVSYVKLDRILRVTPRKVRREGATLDKARFDRVIQALQVYTARTASPGRTTPGSTTEP
jgi:hypothetical protein